MKQLGYNSDLKDKQWERLQAYLPECSTRGDRRRKWEQRVIINAILYQASTGCQWSLLGSFPFRWMIDTDDAD